MRTPLVVLIANDTTVDAERFADELRSSDFDIAYRRVDTDADFRDALRSEAWQLILSDYKLPKFSGIDALRHLRETSLDIPFIVVTDAISEEIAVECLKRGADDFVPKDKLSRLGPVVRHALRARKDHRERLHMEDQLRHAQRLETIGTLAAGVAHDFSNLLTAIVGSTDLLKTRLAGDRIATVALETIEQAVAQATGVTRSLLTFSHGMPSAKQPLMLEAVIRETAQLLERTLPSAIELELDIDDAKQTWVDADRVQIQQVLLNLATNARDAMRDGGGLRIAIQPIDAPGDSDPSESPGRVRLIVADNGIGMTKDMQACILDPFFTTKPRGKGSGLGLAIVQGIAKNHGAELSFESTPERGTVFTVEFPQIAPPQSTAEDVFGRLQQRGRGETILLADKRPYIRELIASSLAALDYNVLRVGDSAAVLAVCDAQRERIQLLVLDGDLPYDGGVECLRKLRSSGMHVPAIVMTDQTDVNLEDTLTDNSLILHRPFQMTDLSRVVASVFRRSRENPTGGLDNLD